MLHLLLRRACFLPTLTALLVVIPRLVRRVFLTTQALRHLPMMPTAGAHPARPKRIEVCAARGYACPLIGRAGAPGALGAVDFGGMGHNANFIAKQTTRNVYVITSNA
jgi:hypothetical protein